MKGLLRKGLCKFITCMFACVLCVVSATLPVCAEDETWPFSLTTTTLSDKKFEFTMSAKGTFYVDCGGGTLSGEGVTDGTDTINRQNNTSENTYTCTYTTTASRTIRFRGLATAYNAEIHSSVLSTIAAISFYISRAKVQSISGNLSTIFPWKASEHGKYPMFYQTFKGCANLTSIPEDLFANLTNGYSFMFKETFMNCTSLTSLPTATIEGQHKLFPFNGNVITGGGSQMFRSTFEGCTGLTSIPSDLFTNVKVTNNGDSSSGQGLFLDTFKGCSSLTEIPEDLFSTIVYTKSGLFNGTFQNCENLKSIPENLFSFGGQNVPGNNNLFGHTFEGCKGLGTDPNISDPIPGNLFSHIYIADQGMFYYTFSDCENLKEIPENLFSSLTSFQAVSTGSSNVPWIFGYTFSGCKSLKSIPAGLFNNMPINTQMFQGTFAECTGLGTDPNIQEPIPSNLFSQLTELNRESVGSLFAETFRDCTGLKFIPENLFSFGGQNVAGKGGMFRSTFAGCTGLGTDPNIQEPVPGELFSHIIDSAGSLFAETFRGCTGLKSIPANLFSFGGNYVDGATRMFGDTSYNQVYSEMGTFAGCTGLESIPDGLFSHVISSANYMFVGTFRECTGLKSLPDNLFSHFTTAAQGMFQQTFRTCSGLGTNTDVTKNFIPPEFFESLTNQYPNEPDATDFMKQVFYGTVLRKKCPANYYLLNTSYYPKYWDEHVSCKPCPNGSHSLAGSTSCGYTLTYSCGDGTGDPWTDNKYYTAVNTASASSVSDHCTAPESRLFSGWKCGEDDIVPGSQITMIADTTCTAQWNNCDTANNWFWNNDNTACVRGYEITLALRPNDGDEWNPPVPDKIYTIYGVGAYLDAERTQKMEVNGGQYHITPPTKPDLIVTFETNGPYNPAALPNQVRRTTTPASLATQNAQSTFLRFSSLDIAHPGNTSSYVYRTDASGYLTSGGEEFAETITDDGIWYADWTIPPQILGDITLNGYTFAGWYDNSEGTGDPINYNALVDFTNNIESNTQLNLYARWEPRTYTIRYNLGDFGAWADGAVHEENATYDVPFEVSHPVSTRAGYIFDGWDVLDMTESSDVIHYYSANPIIVDNTYQSETGTITGVGPLKTSATWFMNLGIGDRVVRFTAQWTCDTANGYHWTDENHTACSNEYTITYNVTNTNGATVSTPDQETFTAFATDYSLATLSIPNGYNCSVWSCTYIENNEPKPLTVENGIISSMPATAVTCNSTCNANTLNLRWDTKGGNITEDLPNSCTYKTDTIELTTPTKTGYDFKGWKVVNWDQNS